MTDLHRSGTGHPAAEAVALKLIANGWKRRQTYGDGVIRLTRGHMALFVGDDGRATSPATEACMIEYARLCGAGVRFKGDAR